MKSCAVKDEAVPLLTPGLLPPLLGQSVTTSFAKHSSTAWVGGAFPSQPVPALQSSTKQLLLEQDSRRLRSLGT